VGFVSVVVMACREGLREEVSWTGGEPFYRDYVIVATALGEIAKFWQDLASCVVGG
jgi:hypothetical protein